MAFTERQRSELQLAKGRTEEGYKLISQHPEWGSLVMNVVWTKLSRGEPVDDFIKYAKVTGKDDEGLIGNTNLIFSYRDLTEMESDEKSPLFGDPIYEAIGYLSSHPDVSVNKLLFEVIRRVYMPKHSTGRVKLIECLINSNELATAVMSEGIKESEGIYTKVIETAGYHMPKDSQRNILGDPFMNSEWNSRSVLLAMDDMNIRGQQLIYAFEYYDKDIHSLVTGLLNRDLKMVEYINYKIQSTGYHLEGSMPIMPKATSSGASFTEGMGFNPPEILMISSDEEYSEVNRVSVDYSTRSIDSTTSLEEGLNILHALGFKDVWKSKLQNISGQKVDIWGDVNYYLILQNPDNGSICEINSATDKSMTHGGIEIMVPFKTDMSVSLKYLGAVEINVVDGKEDYSVGRIQSNGFDDIASIYREFVKAVECEKDTTVLGYGTWNEMPIPKMYDFEHDTYSHKEWKYPQLENFCSQNGLYNLSSICNCLSLEQFLKQIPKKFWWLYAPFVQDRYTKAMDYCHFQINIESTTVYFGVAVNMLDLSDSEIEKYMGVQRNL